MHLLALIHQKFNGRSIIITIDMVIGYCNINLFQHGKSLVKGQAF